MSLRMPQNLSNTLRFETGASVLDHEIAGEKAASLGRAGQAVEKALARLADPEILAVEGRDALLKAAAEAVWSFFVQREVMGLRDQAPAIRHYNIPRAVLVRLGAR
jgi:hypothetical protein